MPEFPPPNSVSTIFCKDTSGLHLKGVATKLKTSSLFKSSHPLQISPVLFPQLFIRSESNPVPVLQIISKFLTIDTSSHSHSSSPFFDLGNSKSNLFSPAAVRL
ncbi:unnamed protein product [Cuscuta europaea]|uniref:Uncharacterized protein n=1 Tax=Cuscuta europaea TaxID=41803 RepID=A0A9P1E2K7_CUSEU|nr:unnamed protein product [Cuscuta europaea]